MDSKEGWGWPPGGRPQSQILRMSRTALWGEGGVREKGPGPREQDVARLGGGGEGRCGKGFGVLP